MDDHELDQNMELMDVLNRAGKLLAGVPLDRRVWHIGTLLSDLRAMLGEAEYSETVRLLRKDLDR